MAKSNEILHEEIASPNKMIDEIKQSDKQLEISKKKNCPFSESGPTYSDSPSDNANSSITSSPTDTLRTSKNPTAKIIKNITPILNKIQKFKNNDFSINYRNGWNGALIGIRKLLQLNYSGGSNYANYETPKGILSLRLSGHNANGNNFNAEHINISVFVALFEYPHIPSDSDYKEFKISQEKYNSNPLKVVREIIVATEKALLGGIFIMDKNIAEEKQYTRETKKLQADVAVSIAVLGESNLVTHPQGEIAKILQNYVSANKNNN